MYAKYSLGGTNTTAPGKIIDSFTLPKTTQSCIEKRLVVVQSKLYEKGQKIDIYF